MEEDFEDLENLEIPFKQEENLELDEEIIGEWETLQEADQEKKILKSVAKTNFIRDLGNNLMVVWNDDFEQKGSNEEVAEVFRIFQESDKNFQNVEENQILFYVDLDNEQIIDKEEKQKREENIDKEICDQELSNTLSPILIYQFPLCPGHVLLPLCYQECLPQVLSSDLLEMFGSLFRMTINKNMKLGYDSLGAGAEYNHLYFHLIFTDQLKTEKFAIELSYLVQIYKCSLKHKEEEIDMFTYGTIVYESKNYPIPFFVIKPDCEAVNETNVDECCTSVANVAGNLVSMLVDNNIPHNLMISDQGTTIYVIPRQPQHVQQQFDPGFWTICGCLVAKTKEVYESDLETWQVESFLSEQIALDPKSFDQLKSKFIGSLASIYM